MSGTAGDKPPPKPRRPGLLKYLGISIPDHFFFEPLSEEELWWWEQGDEPDPCAPP